MKIKQMTMIALLGLAMVPAWAQTDKYDGAPVDILPLENPNFGLMHHKTSTDAKTKSVSAKYRAGRPDHVNNALFKSFVPVFNQDRGSCGSAGAVRYMFTSEVASFRNVDASDDNNSYPSHFTWLTTYSHSDKRQILRHVGVPSAAVYGGRTYSALFGSQDYSWNNYGWMQGYDKWYSAMFNRLQNAWSFPISLETEEGREALKHWMWNHNGDDDFICGGVAQIGVASAVTQKAIPNTAANQEAGVVGMKYVGSWGETYDHSLTMVGYDDRIEFDLDGNGVCGEAEKDEVGAWIIVNSWGAGWANKGFIYCPYAYAGPWKPRADKSKEFFKPTVYFIRKNYRPIRTFKIKMDYTYRSEIALSIGIASDTSATKPELTLEMEHFRYAGNNSISGKDPDAEMPMLGTWADGVHDEPMEFGYDVTDLTSGFDRTKPLKYFFIVKSKSGAKGTGHIYNVSLMDYELDPNGLETPFPMEVTELSGGGKTTMVSMVATGEPAAKPRNLVLNDGKLQWDAPAQVSLKLTGYNVYADGVLIDSLTADATSYTVATGSTLSYSLKARYASNGGTLLSAMSNQVRAAANEEASTDNYVFNFQDDIFTVPDLLNEYCPEFTLEFWVKLKSSVRHPQDIGGFDIFALQMTASRTISFGWETLNSGHAYRESAVTLAADRWNHVALVVDKNTMSVYVNGSRKKQFSSVSYNGVPALGELNFGSIGNPLNCYLDEIRIWKKACTSRELLYNNRQPIARPDLQDDLMAYFKMDLIDDNGETKLRDCARGHHGIFVDYNPEAREVDNSFLTMKRESNANFSISAGPHYPGDNIELTANSLLSATGWKWEVPGADVDNLNSQKAQVVYNEVGKYPVSLTVTDVDGTDTTKVDTIEIVAAPEPVVDFNIPAEILPAGERFSFVNKSTAPGSRFVWTMKGADEETVNGTNAGATYNNAGTYDVTLTAVSSSGNKSVTKQVTVTKAAPRSAFNVSPRYIIKGEEVYLTDHSRYQPTSWFWLITNNGNNSGVVGQKSSFTPDKAGFYNVSLTTTNDQGKSTVEEKNAFIVANADSKNGLHFGGDNQLLTFDCPFDAATSSFTVEWWMNPSKLEGAFSMQCGSALTFSTDALGVISVANSRSAFKSSNNFVIANEWHHYAVVYNAGRGTFYRDGELINTTANTIGVPAADLSGKFVIGTAKNGMNTMMDELRVWGKNFTQDLVRQYANQPIEDVKAAEENDALLLYYNFNQGSGNVTDQTSGQHDGVRSGFGPDGDAWGLSMGVFTLNFDQVKKRNVSSTYLTNYRKNFLYDADAPVQGTSYFKVLSDGDKSTWQTENAVTEGDIITGVHVEKSTGLMAMRTRYNNFAATLKDHKIFQTLKLKKGIYTLSMDLARNSYSGSGSIYFAVNEGTSLPNTVDMATATDAVDLVSQGNRELRFIVTEDDAEFTIGLVFNVTGYMSWAVNEFKLMCEEIEVQQADGIRSLRDAVEKGAQAAIRPIAGGVSVYSSDIQLVTVCDVQGRILFSEKMSGLQRIALPVGIYIVNGTKVAVTK